MDFMAEYVKKNPGLDRYRFELERDLLNGETIVKEELDVLKRIAYGIGISDYDFNSIKSMFIVVGKDSDYEILGITKDATNDEVKKAYKKMAMKHHPDKVAGMGEEVTRKATEKFQAINEAYERIKKERNMV